MNDAPKTPPRRRKNSEIRGREYLEEAEVDRLRKAAASLGRYGHRDATMLLFGFRHGLRVSELVELRWDQVNLDDKTVYVRRKKGSKSGQHTMERDEIQALKKLGSKVSGHVFANERGGALGPRAFFAIMARAGKAAGLGISVHPHMLRHACGYALTKAGHPTRMIQDWLGHVSIVHTVRYCELDPDRFRKAGMWARKPV